MAAHDMLHPRASFIPRLQLAPEPLSASGRTGLVGSTFLEAVSPRLVGPGDRVLVVAPHPDDETLGTGGLLQRAATVGAPVRVLFVTDGDNNPWAQRASELRWRVGPADRVRFGGRRRRESLEALRQLGHGPATARFLGQPDQGLTPLLLHTPATTVALFRHEIEVWQPTLVAGPSLADLHPDHSAVAASLALAFHELRDTGGVPRRLCYVIHNPDLRPLGDPAVTLQLEPRERALKRNAIACHRTQAVLRGPWLRSFAAPRERYTLAESEEPYAKHPVTATLGEGHVLRVVAAGRPRLRAFGGATLHTVVAAPDGSYRSLAVPLSGPVDDVTAEDLIEGGTVALGRERNRAPVTFTMDVGLAPAGSQVLFKLTRRWGFFDEAGWRLFAIPT